jgi:hypothetical protein
VLLLSFDAAVVPRYSLRTRLAGRRFPATPLIRASPRGPGA